MGEQDYCVQYCSPQETRKSLNDCAQSVPHRATQITINLHIQACENGVMLPPVTLRYNFSKILIAQTRPSRVAYERSLNWRCACAMTERRFQSKSCFWRDGSDHEQKLAACIDHPKGRSQCSITKRVWQRKRIFFFLLRSFLLVHLLGCKAFIRTLHEGSCVLHSLYLVSIT